jgi:hypothetical protein
MIGSEWAPRENISAKHFWDEILYIIVDDTCG